MKVGSSRCCCTIGLRSGNTEPQVGVRVGRVVLVAVRGTHVLRVVVPRAPTDDPVGALVTFNLDRLGGHRGHATELLRAPSLSVRVHDNRGG